MILFIFSIMMLDTNKAEGPGKDGLYNVVIMVESKDI